MSELIGYHTVRQIARDKGVSTSSVYSAIQGGRLHHLKIGALYVIPTWEVQAWQPRSRGRPKSR